MHTFFRRFFVTGFLAAMACTTSQPASFGLFEAFKGYVPARTVIWSCQYWPERAVMLPFYPSNVEINARKDLCIAIDEYINKELSPQPYIKAFSANAVDARLKSYQEGVILKDYQQFLSQKIVPQGKESIENENKAYARYFLAHPEWRHWLLDLSNATQHSDAILFPFVVNFSISSVEDRGTHYTRIKGRIAFFLIDTATGNLIWLRARGAQVLNEQPPFFQGQKKVPADEDLHPLYQTLHNKLLSSPIWIDYPGYQGGEINTGEAMQEQN